MQGPQMLSDQQNTSISTKMVWYGLRESQAALLHPSIPAPSRDKNYLSVIVACIPRLHITATHQQLRFDGKYQKRWCVAPNKPYSLLCLQVVSSEKVTHPMHLLSTSIAWFSSNSTHCQSRYTLHDWQKIATNYGTIVTKVPVHHLPTANFGAAEAHLQLRPLRRATNTSLKEWQRIGVNSSAWHLNNIRIATTQ